MEGEKKRYRSFSFPSSPASFLFFASAPCFPLAHTGLFSGEGLELSTILRDMNDWRLTLSWLWKIYITAFLFGNYWHYSEWIPAKSAYLSLLVKGVVGVSLNRQQNNLYLISFITCKILLHSKCEQLTENASVSQSVSHLYSAVL